MPQARSNLYAPPAILSEEIRGRFMLDIVFIAIGFAFLGGAMFYATACDRL
jgi:hypothetical protein